MRIVSLAPSSTEILFALGAGDDVIGVTQNCDYPAEAFRRQRFGTWLHAQPSAIDALKPDIIITTNFFPSELRTYAGHGDILHLEPSNLASVLESILTVGRAIGRYQAAENLVGAMHQQLEDVQRTAPLHQLVVYCESWPTPPMQAGNWVPELVAIAGGNPLGGVHARPSAPVAVDALRASDPDLLVFHWCKAEEVFDFERIRNRPGWEHVRAVQEGAYAFLTENCLNRPGPRLVDGARKLQDIFIKHHRRA